MKQPEEIQRGTNRIFQQEFRGINRKLRPSETEFSEAINLTSREYPALATRRERDYITDIGRCTSPSLCALGNDSVAYISRTRDVYQISIDGNVVYDFPPNSQPYRMIKMGAYLCVFPEGIVFNTIDRTAKRINAFADSSLYEIILSPSKLDGKKAFVSDSSPNEASIGDLWFNPEENKSYLCTAVSDIWKKEDSAAVYANQMSLYFAEEKPHYAVQVALMSGGCAASDEGMVFAFNGADYINTGYKAQVVTLLPENAANGEFVVVNKASECKSVLYRYFTNSPQWTAYPTSYTRIESKGEDLSKLFSEGDVIEVGEYGHVRVYSSVSATDTENGYIVVDHLDAMGTYNSEHTMTLSRNMPSGLSHVFECANRLWGCTADGREIYASKLGDPFNWNAFTGLSSDSYAITVGAGGNFTGGIAYEGYPHFFKEDMILKVYGNYPFRLFSLNCPGVAKESPKSLAVLGGVLIYKGYDGFYAYDGSYPKCISDCIADISTAEYYVTASASDNTSYYAAINQKDGCSIYVYERGFWHIQNAPERSDFFKAYDTPYATVLDLCNTGRRIIAAFVAPDSETEATESGTDFLPATTYLVSLSSEEQSKPESWQVELEKALYLKYRSYTGEFGDGFYFVKERSSVFDAIKVGDVFELNGEIYIVSRIFKPDGLTTFFDVGDITDASLVEGEEYQLHIFEHAPIRWSFTTAQYGLSSPDDKYFSHFIFRYTSDNPVDVKIIYDDGHQEDATLPPHTSLASESIGVIARRCETVRLKMSGVGEFALLSVCGNIEGGRNP